MRHRHLPAVRLGVPVACLLLTSLLFLGALPAGAYAAGASGSFSFATSEHALIAQSEANGNCASGQALVVYHASGASKGSTGSLTAQSSLDPLALAGFGASETWDLSAADDAAGSTGAASGGALSVQSEDGATLASGSDVRVALVERDDLSAADLVSSLEALDFVECAQPNYTHELCSLPFDPGTTGTVNDPLYASGLQYALSSTTSGIGYASELAADAAATSTVDNIVAVVDVGVDYTNPDLKNHMWVNPGNIGLPGTCGYDFYDNDDDPMPATGYANSHGTHCAGLIAAQTNNGAGIAGTAQHTSIMACKNAGSNGDGITDKTIAASYQYILTAKLAKQNVVAVSNSWHIGAYCPVLDYLVNQAGKAGIMSFFAASNAGRDTVTTDTGATADLQSPYAIVVASSNAFGTLSSFSNYDATAVDVAAPGSSMLSTVRASSAEKGATGGGYDSTGALLTGKATACHQWFGDLVDSSGQLVSGASVKLMYRTDGKSPWTLASTADQVHLQYAADASGAYGYPRLKLTIKDIESLSDHDMEHYSAVVTWSANNPFYQQTVTPADYVFGICTSDVTEDTDIQQSIFSLDPQVFTSSPAYTIRSCNFLEHFDDEAITAIDTSKQTMTCTANFMLMTSKTSGDLVCYAESAAIAKAIDMPDYAYMSGTSMSTPLLAGCYAELASLYPSYTPLHLRGLICGGTEKLQDTFDGTGSKKQTATDGRFTFDRALDNSKVNANTWSISTSGDQVSVYGYNLDRATLTVDGSSVTGATAATDGSAITFTAPSSLFDGKSHRFDVTDTSTGRIHQASYVVPQAMAASTVLSRVCALPGPSAKASTGTLVSATDRLFFADTAGDYLYSATSPASGSWTSLASASTVLTSFSGAAAADVRYAYANGKLYAFAGRPDVVNGVSELFVSCATYDIASDTWSAPKDIGSIPPTTSGTSQTYAYASNGDVCFFATCENEASYVMSASSCTMFRMAVGSDAFTQVSIPVDTTDNVQGIAGMYKQGSTLYCLVGDGDSNTLNVLSYDGSAWTSKGALAGWPSMTRNALLDQMKETAVTTGNGVLKIGAPSLSGIGDALLVDPAACSLVGLGSLLGTDTAQITVSGGAMMDGVAYLSGLAADGMPTLYTLSPTAAEKLSTTDVVETAVASPAAGGVATVSDWRGTKSTSLSVRSGDTVSWTATPAAGYAFVGWYDSSSSLVSSAAAWSALETAAQTITARFAPVDYSVAFDGNASDATGSMDAQAMTYDATAKLTSNAFVRTGYEFSGWNTAADGSGAPYANGAEVRNLAATKGAVVTLYAQWRAVEQARTNPSTVTTTPSAGSPEKTASLDAAQSMPDTGDATSVLAIGLLVAAASLVALGCSFRAARTRHP